jgi:hypothetical protein
MNRNLPEEAAIPALHYHAVEDRLFRPISFAFVTRQMLTEISIERQLVLSLVPDDLQARQRRLLEKYDPAMRAGAFNELLKLFGPTVAN